MIKGKGDTFEFTETKLKLLKNAYNKAIDRDAKTFLFNGQQLLTSYAKHLINYLEDQFNYE